MSQVPSAKEESVVRALQVQLGHACLGVLDGALDPASKFTTSTKAEPDGKRTNMPK